MSEQINEKELIAYIAKQTKADPAKIAIVLKHEQAYMDSAKENARGEIEIDGDDLVDYVMGRKDIKSMKIDELTVETILDAEMDYLTEHGLAGYLD